LTDWFRKYHARQIGNKNIGSMGLYGSDFQHNNFIQITNGEHPNRYTFLTFDNLIYASIYFAVRHCIAADWLNDRDQFLYPNDGWETDLEFQSDCLAYTLFHGQNNISSKHGINHWIPFTESEVNSQHKFASHFMSDFINGKTTPAPPKEKNLFNSQQAHTLAASGAHPVSCAATATPLKEGNDCTEGNFKTFAKENRKAGWLHESVFWGRINGKQICGLDFHRQQIIGNYIVDYFSPVGGIAIEIDGKSHEGKIEYDAEREKYLKELGLAVIHISAKDVLQNLDASIEYLKEEIKKEINEEQFPYKEKKFPSLRGVPAARQVGCAAEGGAFMCECGERGAVFRAGCKLWKYYHVQSESNANASLYDIREHFQGRNANGKMNSKSDDEAYNKLIGNLREALKELAKKIEPKVYEYGFLRG
jgi:very-short-patch-repair endonuclease